MQLKEKKRIIITNLAKIWENISKTCELEVVGVFNDPTCAAVFSRWRHVGSTFLWDLRFSGWSCHIWLKKRKARRCNSHSFHGTPTQHLCCNQSYLVEAAVAEVGVSAWASPSSWHRTLHTRLSALFLAAHPGKQQRQVCTWINKSVCLQRWRSRAGFRWRKIPGRCWSTLRHPAGKPSDSGACGRWQVAPASSSCSPPHCWSQNTPLHRPSWRSAQQQREDQEGS